MEIDFVLSSPFLDLILRPFLLISCSPFSSSSETLYA
jgi:hypothetical protein